MSEILYRKTPIMGWASWNCFRTNISEKIMKEQADALVSTGLAECGYTYLNMDDGFFGGRDENGNLMFHKERFPNGIKPVADYAHSLGLIAGNYLDKSTPVVVYCTTGKRSFQAKASLDYLGYTVYNLGGIDTARMM